MPTASVMPSNHVVLCHPLLLLPFSIFPSIRVFSNKSTLYIRWSKYWSFSFRISPSNEYSGLTSFGIDWLSTLKICLFSMRIILSDYFLIKNWHRRTSENSVGFTFCVKFTFIKEISFGEDVSPLFQEGRMTRKSKKILSLVKSVT